MTTPADKRTQLEELLRQAERSRAGVTGAPGFPMPAVPAHTSSLALSPLLATAGPAPAVATAPMAIVGLAGRYPGADTLDEFWSNLIGRWNGLEEIRGDRLEDYLSGVEPAQREAALRIRHFGLLRDLWRFDAPFFAISRREAEVMDPHMRLLLEAAWSCVENAGHRPRALPGRTGVFVSFYNHEYAEMLRDLEVEPASETYLGTATTGAIFANRISYLLGLTGPSEVYDTACSTALVALHRAIQAMRAGECDQAIVAGASLLLTPSRVLALGPLGILNASGICNPYSHPANREAIGEGVGALLLKPLDRAVADGDYVYCVVRGSDVGHQGNRSGGMTLPSAEALAELMAATYRRLGPEAVRGLRYIEGHGAGGETDVIELRAIQTFLTEAGVQGRKIPLGSVKSNIGFGEASGGLAQLTKCALALQAGEIPATLHFQRTDPVFDYDGALFRIAGENERIEGDAASCVSVLAYGLGGTNAHVVLGGHRQAPTQGRSESRVFPLLFSAGSETDLAACLRQIAVHLDGGAASRRYRELFSSEADLLHALARTLAGREREQRCRVVLLAASVDDVVGGCEAFVAQRHDERILTAASATPRGVVDVVIDRARRWANGDGVSAESCFDAGPYQKLPLPPVPFRGEIHRLKSRARPAASATRTIAERWSITREAGAIAAEILLTPEDCLMAQHRVDGLPVLPGVAYIALLAALGRKLHGSESCVIENLAWTMPFTLEQGTATLRCEVNAAGRFRIAHKERAQLCCTGRIVTEPVVASRRDKAMLQACAGTASSGRPAAAESVSARVRAAELNGSIPLVDAAGFWAIANAPETLQSHGPDLRRLSAIHHVAGAMIGVFEPAGNPALELPEIAFYDSALGVCRGFSILEAAAPQPAVPFAVERVHVLRPIIGDQRVYAAVERRTGALTRYDISIEDGAGGVFAVFTGYYPKTFSALPRAAVLAATQRSATIKAAVLAVPGVSPSRGIVVPSVRVALLQNLREQFAAFLKCDVAAVPTEGRMEHLGLDSIGINALTDQLRTQFDLDLPATTLFEHTSLRDVVDYLVAEFGGELERRFHTPSQTNRSDSDVGPAPFGEAKAFSVRNTFRSGKALSLSKGAGPTLEDDIAVVGIGGLFPGAGDVHEFWRRICEGHDLITEMPEARRRSVYHVYRDSLRELQGVHGGFIEDADRFDAGFFGFSEAEVMAMDPQQRLFLEAAWASIEDAGYHPPSLSGQRVGVYVGAIVNEYSAYLADVGYPVSMYHEGTGSSLAGIANRVSYALNLTGPSQSIDAACCSSLYALDRAVRDLRSGVCDAALAGGVSFIGTVAGYQMYSAMKYLARDWRCKAFAAGGDGWSKAELFASVFLKRHADAQRDGDPIYGVIKATGTNHGGRGYFYTQPNSPRHVELVRDVYRAAGVDPAAIVHIEAHGSGTEMGDVLEFNSLSRALKEYAAERGIVLPPNRCGIGSIKSNLGHAEAGSGIVGFIKTVLLLHARQIPPSLHLETINPNLREKGSPLFLVRRPQPLPPRDEMAAPRCASVHSFNFSGATAHALVAEHVAAAETRTLGLTRFPICLSAKSAPVLADYRRKLARFLREERNAGISLDQLAFTLNRSRSQFPHRWGAIVASRAELIERLGSETAPATFYASVVGRVAGRAEDLPELNDANVGELMRRWSTEPAFDWAVVLKDFALRKINLPTYPFDHSVSYFPQASEATAVARAPVATEVPTAPLVAMEPAVASRRDTAMSPVCADSAGVGGPAKPAAQPLTDDSVETQLVEILARVLAVPADEIDLQRAVSDLGFDSAKVIALAAALNERFGLELTPPDLFEFSVPAEIAAFVRSAGATPRVTESVAAHDTAERARDGIAIIGMAGQFPGAADLDEFWSNLVAGHDAITEVPPERWDWRRYQGDAQREANKTDVRWGGFIADVTTFDPLFFGISPREAEWMDPAQRLLLMYAWRAIEDAGYAPSSLAGTDTGIFAGTGSSSYSSRVAGVAGGFSATGAIPSIGPNRLSHFLDLRGPSEPVETSCSSALVAIHRAVSAIQAGECRMAIAGGINTIVAPDEHISFSKAGMLAKDGRCKTFSDQADGYGRGEGVGLVVLKSLAAAERDGDRIHAVIRGSAINHGGRAQSLTAPNPRAQAELLQAAYRKAGIDPRTVGYIEAHGTGTPLGDPIEINGLKTAFGALYRQTGDGSAVRTHCAIGSVKTNIGHLELAAGIAGLIKVVLQLRHRTLVKSLHCAQVNPYLNFVASPFYLLPENREWVAPTDGSGRTLPRRAGVSSFGFGGVNAHVVVEEYCPPAARIETSDEPGPQLIVLSAKSESRLRDVVVNLHRFLGRNPGVRLDDAAFTLQVGRDAMIERLAISAASITELQTKLEQFLATGDAGPGSYRARVAVRRGSDSVPLASSAAASAGDEGRSSHAEQTKQCCEYTQARRALDDRLAEAWANGATVGWTQQGTAKRARRISLPTYPFARDRCWLETTVAVAADLPPMAETADGAEITFLPRWEPADRVDEFAASNLPVPRRWLVVQAGVSSALAPALAERCASLWPDAHGARIELGDATQIERALETGGPVDTLFFISGNATRDPTESHHNEIGLLRLAKALKRRMLNGDGVDLFIVTVDTFRVGDAAVNPAGAGAIGLAYAIAQADHRFRVRNLDVDSEDAASAGGALVLSERILREPPSDRGEAIKLHAGERYRRKLLRFEDSGGATRPGFRQGGRYVLLGGSGRVGGGITRLLYEKYQAEVIWIGRRSADDPGVREKLRAATAGAGCVRYVSGDALDPASIGAAIARIKREHGPIHGAIFAGAIVSFENSFAETTEREFLEILEVKTRGTVNFFAALQDDPLDFLCTFSSAQSFSFSGAANLCAYAAGITFNDAWVHARQSTAPFPIGCINWGFWSAEEGTPASAGSAGRLEPREAFACLEQFVGLLRGRVLHQLVCLRPSDAVRRMMPLAEEYALIAPHTLPPLDLARVGEAGRALPAPSYSPPGDEFDSWILRLLAAQLVQHGDIVPDRSLRRLQTPDFSQEVAEETEDDHRSCSASSASSCEMVWVELGCGLVPRCDDMAPNAAAPVALEKWRSATRRLLEENRAKFDVAADLDAVWRGWDAWRSASAAGDGSLGAQIALAHECLRALPDIFAGRVRPTDILFPGASMDRVEAVYRDNGDFAFFNRVVAETVRAAVDQIITTNPAGRVRILEIGAGTGGTTATILARLDAVGANIGDYVYTDVSRAFLAHGERTFGAGRSYLTFRALDIEQPDAVPLADIGSFDVVIAANVLHATKDIRRTVRQAKAALKQGGLLVLNEIAGPSLFAHATFGLLDGWWRFEDAALRIPGSPGLYPETWGAVLCEEGFRSVAFPAESAHALGQQVVVAASDGVIFRTPVVATLAPAAAPVVDRAADDSEAALERLILGVLSSLLKIPEAQFQRDMPFADYGVDSILGVSFVTRLGDELGLSLNSAILFEYATIERLVGYLRTRSAERRPVAPVVASRGDKAVLSVFAGTVGIGRPAAEKIVPLSAMCERSVAGLTTRVEKPRSEYPAEVRSWSSALPGSTLTTKAAGGNAAAGMVEIAVIGMAGQFPGATDVDAFWRNLVAGKNCTAELPAHYRDRAGVDGYRWGGALEERACFDPLFFNVSPREAESMTPHQRLILQESWKALEDAGINPRSLAGAAVGLFVGAEPSGYEHETFTGASDAIIASRLAYFLNLKGPALVVNTGCSSSAAAIHLACESLVAGGSTLALAGGVFATMGGAMLTPLARMGMLSTTGCCRPFDAAADGTVFSEGVGVVVLKRLRDAIADGDSILGVIQASGMNQDGASNGLTAPNGEAQEALIADLYRRHAIDPERIGYLEAHGTGTRLGDPVEANALARAFRQFTTKQNGCVLGSVKSAIGHASAASGVISLIKVLLMLRHGMIPPQANFTTLNPLVELSSSPFRINREAEEWPAPAGRARFAAINSFGHSGTNVHLVVRSFDATAQLARAGDLGPQVIVLSAKEDARLREVAIRLADYLDANPAADLASVAFTLQVGREPMKERLAFAARDLADLRAHLGAWITDGATTASCWRGRVEAAAGVSRLLQSPEDTRELTSRWAGSGRLDKMADLWCQGGPVDWTLLHAGANLQRVRLPTYPFAKEPYWAPQRGDRRDMGAAASVSAKPTDSADAGEVLFFEEVWAPLRETHGAPAPTRVSHVLCLLSDPQRQAAMRAEFMARDPQMRVHFVGRSEFADGAATVFRRVQEAAGPIDAVLWLWPLEDRALITDATAPISLLQALRGAGLKPRHVILAGEFVDGVERCHLESWIGLERSVAFAWTDVRVTVLLAEQPAASTSESSATTWVARCSRILADENAASTLFLGGTPHALRRRTITMADVASPNLDGKTILIAGGGGGLGMFVAQRLTERGSVNLILTGRSARNDRVESALRPLTSRGCAVHYVQANVSDAVAMRAGLAEARAKFGPIHGAIHAAGTKDERTLFEKSAADAGAVLAAKVRGTLVLDEVLVDDPLEFVTYFSSTAAVLGDFGAGDYAIGNRFLLAYAAHRNALAAAGRRQGRAVAIAWSAWRGAGMGEGTAEAADVFLKSSGQRTLRVEEGLAAFAQILAQPRSQVCVVAGEAGRMRRTLGLFQNHNEQLEHSVSWSRGALAAEHEQNAARAPHPQVVSGLVNDVRDDDREARLRTELRHTLAALLKLSPERIGAQQNFADFGLDSVSLIEFARVLSADYGLELTPAAFFGHSTIDALAKFLVGQPGLTLRGAAETKPAPAMSSAPTDADSPAAPEPIAIIGLSGRFADARTADEMWQTLRDGRSVIREMPPERFGDHESTAGLWCGCLPGAAEFDAAFFEISPLEAENMDPRQRLLLQEGWAALEDAGYGRSHLEAQRIGMFVGAEDGDYQQRVREGSITSNHGGVLAARLAYFLDLKGPVMTLNTSCSSSLVAAHQACASLRNDECDAALVAGINLLAARGTFTAMAEAGMLSADGACRAFDRRANGMVPGEAVAVIVLKRLSRALADGDAIHAVIAGSGINYDGRTNGITAPNGVAQVALLKSVYRQAAIDPADIDLIVTHGTGTRLGDPVEVNALREVFATAQARPTPCVLVSCKPNLGHAFAASGLVSVIALVQALRNATLPGSVHFEERNEFIQWDDEALIVRRASAPWPAAEGRVRAGAVSAFGMSGTNAHLVLREPPARSASAAAPLPWVLLAWSAAHEEALRERTWQLAESLKRGGTVDADLPALSSTLLCGRHHFRHRCAVVVRTIAEAFAVLEALAATPATAAHELRAVVAPRFETTAADRAALAALLAEAAAASAQANASRLPELLGQLAARYREGHEGDWAQLFGGRPLTPRRLPTYPFMRREYWLPAIDETSARAPATKSVRPVPAPTSSILLSPLLDTTDPLADFAARLRLPDFDAECAAAIADTAVLEMEAKSSAILAAILVELGLFTTSTSQKRLADIASEASPQTRDQRPETKDQRLETKGQKDQGTKGLSENSTCSQRLSECKESRGRPAAPHLERWLAESRRLLTESGFTPENAPDAAAAWRAWEQAKPIWAGSEALRAREILMEACLLGLPDILRGRRRVTEVIFPDGSVEMVEPIYRLDEVAALFNETLASVVVAWAESRLANDRGAQLRIIEVGAGTGGSTAVVLPQLERFRPHIVEYAYTDVSNTFLEHARERFVLAHPFVGPKLFDVSEPAAAQGIATSHYDLVIAANVLHATNDVRRTVRIAKSVLRPGGLLLLSELSSNGWFTHFPFGMLEGWWHYTDSELRIPGCPGLSSATWSRLLREEGFAPVMFPAEKAHMLGQQLIVAVSDGRIVEEPREATKPTPAREVAASAAVTRDSTNETNDRQRCTEFFREVIAQALKMPTHEIDPEEALEAYGVDSLTIGKVLARLRGIFADVPSTLLFETRTVAELANHFWTARRADVLVQIGEGPAGPAPAPTIVGAMRAAPEIRAARVAAPIAVRATSAPPPAVEPIAIIGLAGRYPAAPDLRTFWENLCAGKDCITEIPPERWPLEGFYEPDLGRAIDEGKSACKWGAFLEGFDEFDPLFFKIAPREALHMDPQERLFVQTAWEVLEDAGYTPKSLIERTGGRVGVFTAITHTDYNIFGPDQWRRGQWIYPRTSFSSVPNRVSFLFNFQGPSVPIDTMCSSSLTALHQACESILRGECSTAIAGAVNLCLHPSSYVALCAARMLSQGRELHSFGVGDDGYIPGEGVGAVLLKRLSEAIRDGDQIHALIRGTAVNHGGRTNGYTVPDPQSQGKVIREALDRAGVNARTISYIEAHGTGTKLGDPIEVAGLTRAFRAETDKNAFCAIGSVKSNVGHLEAAAGIVGLTKVILAMQHGQLPASLHAEVLNPEIEFAQTPFVVQRALAPWTRPTVTIDGVPQTCPRRAGISAFGAGGANAHVVVEEYADARPACAADGEPCIVVLSARDAGRLDEVVRRLLAFVRPSPGLALADIAYTLQIGRDAMDERLGLVVSSMSELEQALQNWSERGAADGVRRGSARSEERGPLLESEELAALVPMLVACRKYDRLLALWVRGCAIDWFLLYGAGRPRRVSLPVYPFARERYWFADTTNAPVKVENDPAPAAPIEPVMPVMAPAESAWAFLRAAWAATPFPEQWDWKARLQQQAGRRIAIVAADRNEGESLAALLRQLGTSAEISPPLAVNVFAANEVFPAHELPHVVLCLGPGASAPAECEPGPADIELVFNVSQQLMNACWGDPVALYYLYGAADARPRLACEALSGFVRSAVKENEQHAWMLIRHDEQLSPEERHQVLLKEWLFTGPPVPGAFAGVEVRHLGERREVKRLVETALPPVAAPVIRDRGVYLIAGGFGYLGQQLSLALAQRHRATLVLLTRGPMDEARRGQVRQLEALGARVFAECVDVTDREALERAYRKFKSDVGAVNGVFHLARQHDDRMIARKTWASFAQVIRTKVQGTLHLDAVTQDEPLDFFMLFSSLGAYGVRGASDYAYATAFQNAFSAWRVQLAREGRRRGASVAVCWGPWLVDRLFPKSRQTLVDAGFALIGIDAGFPLIERAIANTVTPLTVIAMSDPAKVRGVLGLDPAPAGAIAEESGNGHRPQPSAADELEREMRRWEECRARGADISAELSARFAGADVERMSDGQVNRIYHLLLGANGGVEPAPRMDNGAGQSVTAAATTRIAAAAGAPEAMAGLLRNVFKEVLQLTAIQDARTFQDYGLDSISGMQTAVRLEKVLKREVPPQWLINFPTIAVLSKHLIAEKFDVPPAAGLT